MTCLSLLRGSRRILAHHLRDVLAASLAVVLLGSVAPARAGLTITPTFDSSITSDPNAAAIEGAINAAISVYENTFSNNINVTIYFQEGGGLGESGKELYFTPYSSFRSALASELAANPSNTNLVTALAHLPNTTNNPVTGTSDMTISTANLKALGFGSFPGVSVGGNNYDGQILLNTSLTTPGSPGSALQYSLQAVAEHEIDEVLGLGSALNQSFQSSPSPEDLYRYASNGSRSYTTNSSAKAYFSLDGTNLLAQFDNQNDGGDWGDWQSNPLPPGVAPKVQDAFGTPGSAPTLGVELTALNAIGYTFITHSAVPEPSSLSLLGCGMLALSAIAWRSRKRGAGRTAA
jgi:hypothetical protein